MDIPIGWRSARTRGLNGTMGLHGRTNRWGLLRTTNVTEVRGGHGTMLCKACLTYFLSAEAALAHECPKEDEYREYVGLSSRESPTEAPPEAETPAPQLGYDYEMFVAWINDVVSDRNSLRTQVEVLRAAVQETETQIVRLKGEVAHNQQVAEKFRRVALAREAVEDFGDYHIRKAQTK